MIVVDASVWAVSFLDNSEVGSRSRAALEADHVWAAPGHAPLEVLRTLGKFERAGHLTRQAADVYAASVVARQVRYSTIRSEGLAWAWSQRHNLSYYDAPYVHLASRLGVTLVTLDQRLAAAAAELGVAVAVPA